MDFFAEIEIDIAMAQGVEDLSLVDSGHDNYYGYDAGFETITNIANMANVAELHDWLQGFLRGANFVDSADVFEFETALSDGLVDFMASEDVTDVTQAIISDTSTTNTNNVKNGEGVDVVFNGDSGCDDDGCWVTAPRNPSVDWDLWWSLNSAYEVSGPYLAEPAIAPPDIDDGGFCSNFGEEISTSDGSRISVSPGNATEEMSETVANILETINNIGDQIAGTFGVGGDNLSLNLGNLLSLRNFSLHISFSNLDGSTGQTLKLGSSIFVTIDPNEISSSSNPGRELIATVIHELLHISGHVNGINAMIENENDIEAAAQNLTDQLLEAIENARIDINADRPENCDN